jgi:hypothetical protein
MLTECKIDISPILKKLQTTWFKNLKVTFKETFGTLRLRSEGVSKWPNSLID